MGRDYLSRLNRAARWYLPAAEAAEVLEDYREIVEGRSEEELRRDLGTPRTVARQLVQKKAYRRWLAVFGGLSVCLLLPAADVVRGALSWLFGLFLNDALKTPRYAELMLPLGTVLALVWFQRSGRKEQKLSKWVVPLLIFLLLGIAWVSFLGWLLFAERWDLLNSLFPEERVWLHRLTLGLDALAAGVIGMLGLVKARLTDRRWRAVYVLGLTGAVACLFIWKMYTGMFWDYRPGWQTPYVIRYTVITLLGLIGTGVSLYGKRVPHETEEGESL